MTYDGVYDGKRHLFGQVRTQVSQEFAFLDIGYHLSIAQGYLLACGYPRPPSMLKFL
jgi:hypothetical protein